MPQVQPAIVLAPVLLLGWAVTPAPMPRTLGYRKAWVGVQLGVELSSD